MAADDLPGTRRNGGEAREAGLRPLPWPPDQGRPAGQSGAGALAASFAGSLLLAMALGHLSVQQSWFNLGFGGVRLGLYPPWTAGLLWTLWFGWGYGAVITFVCALALSLLAGLGGWSVPVALADSTGLGVLFIFLRGFPIDPRLGAWRDRGIFAAAVFFASVAGGCGALVVGLATGMSRVEVLNLWQGWWLGHAAEGLLLAGGIAMAFGRSVERWKEDWFNLRHPSATFRRQVAAAVVAGVSAIAFYTAWTHEAGMSVLEEIYGAVSHDAARERLLEAYGRAHFQHGLVIASLLGALAWGVVMLLILRRRYQDQLRDEVNRTTAALRRRHLQLVALQALTESLSRSQDPREIAARLAEHSARLIEPGAVTVYLRDADQPGRLKLASRHAGGIPEPHPEPPEELKAGASLAGHVLEKNEVVVLDRDAAAHPLAGASAGFLKALEAQAYIGVPISGKAARRGVFELVLCRSYRREDEELRLFRLIGQSVGAALERAERHVRAQRRADALEALGQLTKDLAGASETEPLLERFADGARRLLNAQALGVALEDPAPGGGLRLAAVSAAPGVEAPAAGARWPREAAPLLDACLNAGEPQSVGLEPAASESVEIAPGWNAQALLLAPLPGREPAQGGVLVAVFAPDEAQGEEALELVEELARQCAAGLRRVGLLDATRRQTAEIALFEQIGRAFAGHLNARETLRILVRNVEKIVPAEWGGVLRYEPGAEQLAVETTTIPHPEAQEVRIPLDAQALVCACFREGRTLVSADMRNDPRANPELSARFGSGSGVFVPLGSARARFGVLFAMSAAARGFDAEDVRRLEQVAALAAAALERARLYDEVQHRADELALLHEAGQILVETPLLETSLRRIAEVVRVHFGVAGVGFLLADAARSKLTLAGLAVPKTGGLEGRSVPLDGPGPTATAFREARTVVLEDDAREAPSAWVRECLPGFRSGVVLPMPTAHGPVGVLGLFDTAPRAYSAEELSRLEAVARLAASAVERGALGRRLQASEARVQELLDGMPALVIGVDAGGTVTHFNAAAEHLFGWRRDEAVGRDAFALMHRDAREAAARREELRRVLSEGRAIAEAVIAVEPRAGAPRRVLWHLEPLHDAEGKIGGAVGMGLDVTERQALETQLHQAQKMESVGALAGGMAHDFNNLLGGILGQARLARAQLPAASELRATIEKIEAAAQRGADLTGKLLAFARTPVLQPRPVDLGALLDETADLLAGSLPGNIEIRRRIEPRLPVVHGDVTQLQQVLLNLCVNARDAMPQGGTLTLRARAEDERTLCVDVEDTGAGMDEHVKAHLFEPFFTTKEPGKGTGLGLAVVFGIVRNHGGAIEVQSDRGAGARFRIRLPARAPDPERDLPPAPDPEPAPLSAAPFGGTEELLIVDDNQIVRETNKALLKHLGYRVWDAAGGEEALRRIDAEGARPQAIILDVVMPGLSGVPLLLELRRRMPKAGVILISGYSRDNLARDLLEAGALELIPKPFSLEELGRAVRRALASEAPAPPARKELGSN